MPNMEQLFQELNKLLEHEASTRNYGVSDPNINHSELITILSNDFLSTQFTENDRREIGSLFIMWRFRERLSTVEKRHLYSGLELYYKILKDPENKSSYLGLFANESKSSYRAQFENHNQQYMTTQFPDVPRIDGSEQMYEEIIATLCKNYFSEQFNETDRKDIGSLFILWKFRESLIPHETKHLNSYLHFFYDVLRHESRTRAVIDTSVNSESTHEPETSDVDMQSLDTSEVASVDVNEETPVSPTEEAYSQVLSLIKDHFMDTQNNENSHTEDRAQSSNSLGEVSHQSMSLNSDEEDEPPSGDDTTEEDDQIIGKEMIIPRSLRGRHANPVHEHFYQKITLVKDRVKIQEICKACGDGVSNSVRQLNNHLKKCKMRGEENDADPNSRANDQNSQDNQDISNMKKIDQSNEPLSQTSNEPFPAKTVTISGRKMYSCEHCAFHTTNKRILMEHRLSHKTETFDCGVCSYKTHTRLHFLAHLREHTGERIYKCDMCNVTTLYESVMIRHSKKMHQKRPKLHKCKVCSYNSYLESDVDQHMKGHDLNSPFQCVICSSKFTEKSYLIQHLKQHTGESQLKCDACSFIAKDRQSYNAHCKTYHLNDDFRESTREDPVARESTRELPTARESTHEVLTEKRTYNCDVCSFTSNRETSYLTHLKTHITPITHSENSLLRYMTNEFDKNSASNKLPRLNDSDSLQTAGQFKCEICLKHYSSKYSLAIHMKLHTEGRPFKCSVCPYSSAQKAGLLKHLTKHDKDTPETGIQLMGLQSSSREMSKNYYCEICLKGYSTKYSLATHMKLHAEGKLLKGVRSPAQSLSPIAVLPKLEQPEQ